MLFFSLAKGAMNAQQYWELCDDACSAVETSANAPRFSCPYTDKKDNKIFLIYKESQMGAVPKS
jgi:hypothetical protein